MLGSARRAHCFSQCLLVTAGTLAVALTTASALQAAVPPAPVLVAPTGSVPDPDPTYTWNASTGATQYMLQVYDSVGNRLLQRLYDATAVCVGSVCSKTETLVLALGSYHWKVQARNASGGTWSADVWFTVVEPAAPVLNEPTGPLINPTPTYRWTGSTGATQYVHKVLDSSGALVFQRTYSPGSVCQGTACSSNPGVALGMGSYSWTMRANHASGGTTSASKSFNLGCEARVVLGDFNGDGRTDRLCSVGSTYVSVSTGTGFINGAVWLGTYIEKPIAGDFNADGRTDIGGYDRWTGIFRVALSTGTAFAAWAQWGTAAVGGITCSGSGPDVYAADFNGDGRSDVVCKNQNITSVFVGLSTGTGFNFSIFGDAFCGTNEHTGTMDMDGDGKSDWFCLAPASDIMLVFPSTGSGFRAPVSAADGSFCDDAQYIIGDWNGDGKTDLGCFGNGKVRLSTGNAFLDQTASGAWCENPIQTEWPYAFGGDVDGDGSQEMICGGMGPDGNAFRVRKWLGLSFGPTTLWISGLCWGYAQTGDFDGDGKTDLLCDPNQDVAVAGTSKLRADVMVQATNPIGGTATATYQPASNFPNGPGFGTAPVATAVTVSDGRGSAPTTTFSYEGGQANKIERQSLGFHSVTATLPCLTTEAPPCPYRLTTFMQGLASAGSVSTTERRAGDGTTLAKQAYTYDERTTLPRRSRAASSTATTYGPPGTERSATVNYELYDDYGNLTQSTAWGDPTDSADDLRTVRSFSPNTLDYIIDRVAKIEEGAPNTEPVTKQELWYDNSGSWNTPPTKGDLTTVRGNLDGRWVAKTSEYTGTGMLSRVTDETARWTELTYDSNWGLFPVTVTDADGSVQQSWDFGCQALTSVTDLNQQTTTSGYDPFCRNTRTEEPETAGGFVEYRYLDLGNPTLQRARVETNAPPGASGLAWTDSYFDGFGRTYRTVSRGPGQDIIVDRAFNPRAGVQTDTQPYYDGEAALVTAYQYDALDRVTRVNLPGSGTITTTYMASSQTTADPNGKSTTTRFDHFGRVKAIERPFNGQIAVTTLHYDRLGRQDGLTDPVQAAWTWGYDSLGRLRDDWDPDRGHWQYGYDDAGRLTSQTDAKGQVTAIEYDTSGRIWTRQNAAGTAVYTYGEPHGSYSNAGRLTTLTYTTPNRPVSILRFDYDELGRVAHQWPQVDGTTYSVTKAWAPGGYHVATTYPNNDAISIGYDEAGRVSSIDGILNSVTYDASGRPLQRVNANGTTTSWSYSQTRGVLEGISTNNGTIQNRGYIIDDAGLARTVTSNVTGGSWQYDYDDLYHLRHATNVSSPGESQDWEYDAGDRITFNTRIDTHTYTYPQPGQPRPHAPLSANGAYTYDPNGNLLSGGGRAPGWTADNLIEQLGAIAFSYDGLGERIKTTDGSTTSVYPFGDDYEITDGVITTYISTEGLGVVAKKVTGGPDPGTFWIHTDRLGSIDAVTRLGGVVALGRTYRPYGETLDEGGDHTESRGWIDQRNDTGTGLTYLHARYFDPQLGIFLSPDPIGVAGGMNAYGYAQGDPVNGTDRSGLVQSFCANTNDNNCGKNPDANEANFWAVLASYGKGSGIAISPLALFGLASIFSHDNHNSAPVSAHVGHKPNFDPNVEEPEPWPDPVPSLPPPTPPGPPAGGGGGNTGRHGSVGAPGTFEYMIPVWGSGRAAIDDFQNDEWADGCFNTVMACSDVFLVKSLLTGAGKGLWKIGGSHSWKRTSRWLTRRGWREYKGQHAHHWFLERQGRIGSFVPESIKNQPWNLHLLDRRTHMRLHGLDPEAMVFAERLWFGTPHWSKALVISGGGRPVGMILDDE